MGEACSARGKYKKYMEILIVKPESKRPHRFVWDNADSVGGCGLRPVTG
jgi:hypothetical protein